MSDDKLKAIRRGLGDLTNAIDLLDTSVSEALSADEELTVSQKT